MADNIQHEDFGEKIGGAKKDLWKDRGLYVNDLDAMNEREAEKFVKKDNIWKKPDYQAMLDDGIPLVQSRTVEGATFIRSAKPFSFISSFSISALTMSGP